MPNPYSHDAVIIGVGQAGNPLASALAGAGWKVAVTERNHVGGACVNEGCTPIRSPASALYLSSARIASIVCRPSTASTRKPGLISRIRSPR